MPLPKPSRPPDHDLSPHGQSPGHSEDTLVTHLRSPKFTESLGQAIGRQLCGGEIIALTGELGAGKTVLAKGIASGVGISPDQVTSPTFTFIQEYSGRIPLVHADLYRIKNLDELQSIGLEDYFDPSTVVIIEWADRMGPEFPQDVLLVHLAHLQRYSRIATLKAHGPLSRSLLQRLKTKAEKNIPYRTRNIDS